MRSLPVPAVPGSRSPRRILRGLVLAIATPLVLPIAAQAQIPDVNQSFFVPHVGQVMTPTEGTLATRFFRMCPNNDGGSSLPNHARIKIVLIDSTLAPIPNVSAADIYLLFNGGTPEQGFSGPGADSIIANSTYNPNPACPDVRMVHADAPTDAAGVTYLTFAGASPSNPGVTLRDPNRKWGHYDSEIPVYALGVKLRGQLTSASAPNTYVLRIKNLDCQEGLGAFSNEGEAVTVADLASVVGHIGVSSPISYWLDFDGSGSVSAADLNMIVVHWLHDCDTPNNP